MQKCLLRLNCVTLQFSSVVCALPNRLCGSKYHNMMLSSTLEFESCDNPKQAPDIKNEGRHRIMDLKAKGELNDYRS